MDGEHGKIGTGPPTSIHFRRLCVRFEGGQGQTHPRVLAHLNYKDTGTAHQTGLSNQAIDVPDRVTNSHRKVSPLRPTPHETNTVALEKQLEGTRITRKGNPHTKVTPTSPNGGFRKTMYFNASNYTLCHALQIFYRCIKEGWGAHLGEHTARGTWSLPEIKLHINYLKLKVVFLALKEFQDLCSNKIVLVANNTTVVAHINKEGCMRSGSLCTLLWRIMTLVLQDAGDSKGPTYSRPADPDSDLSFQRSSS